MTTFEDILRRSALRTPGKVAIGTSHYFISYAELWKEVCNMACELGDVRGKAIAFRATPEVDTLVRYFALHIHGATAVLLDKDMPEAAEAELKQRLAATPPPPGVADILFTTGTTGQAKGVMISHDAIIANAENLIDAQGYTQETEFIVNGPLNHIGSLSKIFPTLYVGGTVEIIDGMRDLNAFFKIIERSLTNKVATFLVPANIRILLALGRQKLESLANKIDFIETGAAPLAQSDMEKLCATLPQTRLFNTYASTETGIIATFNFNAGECLAGCLGTPMTHSQLSITPDGRVRCSGPTLMTGYYDDPALTASILQDNAIVTNDLAYLDEQGRLRLTGRDDDVINIDGFKVNPAEVEEAAMSVACVKDCICVADATKLGNRLKLIVVPNGPAPDFKTEIASALRLRLEPHKVPTAYEAADKIKRTFNGKLDRKAYRE